MAKARKSFPLRMDPQLFEKIQSMAAQEMRSVNAQIEYLLADAVRRRRGGQQSSETETDQNSDGSESS